MRYFSYDEPNEDFTNNTVVTKSEEEIRKEYYPLWHERMCKRFGKEVVDRDYSFEDCLQDWIVVNWAWEITE